MEEEHQTEPALTGDECLRLIGLDELVDRVYLLEGGREIRGGDFTGICAPALPAFEGFKNIDPSSEEYDEMKLFLQRIVGNYIGPHNQI